MVKLKGTTLVETLVAMVITVTGISISIMIYISVITSDKQSKLTIAKLLIEQEVGMIKQNQLFVDGEFIVDGILIQKQFTTLKTKSKASHLVRNPTFIKWTKFIL